jgi:hypothetical protein
MIAGDQPARPKIRFGVVNGGDSRTTTPPCSEPFDFLQGTNAADAHGLVDRIRSRAFHQPRLP